MKLLYAILIAFVLSPAAFGQKITMKDLDGTWHVVAIGKEGAHGDLETGKVTVTEEWKKNNPDKSVAEMEEKLKGDNPFSSIEFVFKDGMMSASMRGEVMEESVVSLEEEDGRFYLGGGVMGGDRPEITLIDGRLTLDIKEQGMFMELKKKSKE